LILVDANLLIYAVNGGAPRHAVAKTWLDARLNGPARVGLPWASLLAFQRLVTNPRIFPRPLGMGSAWKQVDAWLSVTAARQDFVSHRDETGQIAPRDENAAEQLLPNGTGQARP